MQEDKYRKVRVLREVETTFDQIREGEIFRCLPASETDIQSNPTQYHLATAEPSRSYPFEDDQTSVESVPINFIPGLAHKDRSRTMMLAHTGMGITSDVAKKKSWTEARKKRGQCYDDPHEYDCQQCPNINCCPYLKEMR
jgi:hypothetical protein